MSFLAYVCIDLTWLSNPRLRDETLGWVKHRYFSSLISVDLSSAGEPVIELSAALLDNYGLPDFRLQLARPDWQLYVNGRVLLGIADGIIQSGVPSVLGYRWPVPAVSAKEMALAFYRSILEHGSPELALLDARRELGGRDKDDLTWASPILISQS